MQENSGFGCGVVAVHQAGSNQAGPDGCGLERRKEGRNVGPRDLRERQQRAVIRIPSRLIARANRRCPAVARRMAGPGPTWTGLPLRVAPSPTAVVEPAARNVCVRSAAGPSKLNWERLDVMVTP